MCCKDSKSWVKLQITICHAALEPEVSKPMRVGLLPMRAYHVSTHELSWPWPETCLGFGHWLSIIASSVGLLWRHCSDQTWTEVCDRLRLVSRWRTIKRNRILVNCLLKHDGFIVRIQNIFQVYSRVTSILPTFELHRIFWETLINENVIN